MNWLETTIIKNKPRCVTVGYMDFAKDLSKAIQAEIDKRYFDKSKKLKPEDLSAIEVLDVLERFAEQYGYISRKELMEKLPKEKQNKDGDLSCGIEWAVAEQLGYNQAIADIKKAIEK